MTSQSSSARSSSLHSTCPATVLPAETIGKVLAAVVEGESYAVRQTLLIAASFVCQLWRDEAQRLLWEEVELETQEEADQLLASEALGRYRTTSLKVSGYEGPSDAKMVEVFLHLRGVRRVNFHYLATDYRTLSKLSLLPDLAKLRISGAAMGSENENLVAPPTFTSLELKFFESVYKRAFSFFATAPLSQLTLYGITIHEGQHDDFRSLFLAIGSQLRILNISTLDYNGVILPISLISESLAFCADLEELQIVCLPNDVETLLKGGHPHLATLILRLATFGAVIDFKTAVESLEKVLGHGSMSELRIIEFPNAVRPTDNFLDGVMAKGCIVRFKEEIDWSARDYLWN